MYDKIIKKALDVIGFVEQYFTFCAIVYHGTRGMIMLDSGGLTIFVDDSLLDTKELEELKQYIKETGVAGVRIALNKAPRWVFEK